MPDLPALPSLTQEQYDYLVTEFGKVSDERGLNGPADAYTQWSMGNLVDFVRSRAYASMEEDVNIMKATRRAEVDAMLANLIGG